MPQQRQDLILCLYQLTTLISAQRRRRDMRIAQIAPLAEAVPPKFYGGTERVVSYLTEELVALGHEVTLFASGDSVTTAELDAVWPQALRLDPTIRDWSAPLALLLGARAPACRRVRRAALPSRLLAGVALRAPQHPVRHHVAWPARPAGAAAGLRGAAADEHRLDFRSAASSAQGGALCRHGSARIAVCSF